MSNMLVGNKACVKVHVKAWKVKAQGNTRSALGRVGIGKAERDMKAWWHKVSQQTAQAAYMVCIGIIRIKLLV